MDFQDYPEMKSYLLSSSYYPTNWRYFSVTRFLWLP